MAYMIFGDVAVVVARWVCRRVSWKARMHSTSMPKVSW